MRRWSAVLGVAIATSLLTGSGGLAVGLGLLAVAYGTLGWYRMAGGDDRA